MNTVLKPIPCFISQQYAYCVAYEGSLTQVLCPYRLAGDCSLLLEKMDEARERKKPEEEPPRLVCWLQMEVNPRGR